MVEQAQSKTATEVSATEITEDNAAPEKSKRKSTVKKRFGSEIDVEDRTGIKRATLQADRFFNRNRFPYYRVRGRILYDLDEVDDIILASRQGGAK